MRGRSHLQQLLNMRKTDMKRNNKYFIMLPKFTSKMERILLAKLKDFSLDNFNMDLVCRNGGMLAELLYHVEYASGDRFIVDTEGVTLAHIAALNPQQLLHFATEYQAAFPARIKGIDFINLPSFAKIIINLVKTILPAKIFSRVKCHSSLESLHSSIPKDLLPKDLGGDLPKLEELIKMFDVYVETHRHVLRRSMKEYFTVAHNENENCSDVFSVQGTFRQLSID